MDEGRCKSCGVGILFIPTPSGSIMPCDKRRVSIVTAEGRVVQGWNPHWSTCPSAAMHRKPKTKGDNEPTTEEAKDAFRVMKQQLGLGEGPDGPEEK